MRAAGWARVALRVRLERWERTGALYSVWDDAEMLRDVAPSLDAYYEAVTGCVMVTVAERERSLG